MQVLISMRLILIASAILSLPMLAFAQADSLNVEQILSHMQQARTAAQGRSIPYTVTREYQLSAEGSSQANSEVVAQVSFVPPTAKEYTIVKAEGSDRGESVVRKVLDHEISMATHADENELASSNYEFALLGHESIDGHDCYVLGLTPKREAVELVRGKAWIDANTFRIRRVAGQTSKNPSFWIKRLNVTLNYGEVNGVWVQTSTKALADVRIAGPHVLTSRDLDVQRATFSARSQTPRLRNQRSNAHRDVADTATWVAR